MQEQLVNSFRNTTISAVLAGLAAAASMAVLVAAGFLVLDIPGAFLAGGLTFIFAWIPVLGTTPALLAGVREHELAAQWTTLIWGLLSFGFSALWVLPLFRRQALSKALETVLLALWLLLSVAGVLALGRTGHLGGHLVHDLHTHAGPEPPLN